MSNSFKSVLAVSVLDEPRGIVEKLEAHKKGVLHRAFSVFLTDENGNTTTNRVPSTYEFIFGNHFTAQDADGNEAEYVYYTATGSEILYRTPISVFDEIMSWMEYTAPETDEADGTESDADSADTAAVTE